MSHPSEAVLIAFADGEIDHDRRRVVDAHLQRCGICRHALRDLEGAMAGLTVELALVDAAEPSGWRATRGAPDPRAVSARSNAAAASPGGARRPRALSLHAPRAAVSGGGKRAAAGGLRGHGVAMRWAAALVFVVAGGATAMVAPRWRSMLESSPADAAPTNVARVAAPATSAPTAAAAVSILPERGEATVALTSRMGVGDGRVMVRVSDRRDVQVTVTASIDSGSLPRFTSADGRLDVQLSGHGSVVQVEFPSSLRSARITHDGRTIVTVRGSEVSPASAGTTGVVIGSVPEP